MEKKPGGAIKEAVEIENDARGEDNFSLKEVAATGVKRKD